MAALAHAYLMAGNLSAYGYVGLTTGAALAGLLGLELAGLAEQQPGLRFRRRAA